MVTAQMVVNLTWTQASGSPGVNVWHMRSDQGVGPFTDLNDVSGFVKDFYTGIQALYPDELNIQMFGELTGLGDDAGSIYDVDSWGLAGSGGDAFLPPADCLLASWKAQTGGRSGRGRTFLGPLAPVCSNSAGAVTVAAQALVTGAMAALIDSSEGFANGALGIYSRKENIFRDFVSGVCRPDFAVLRSRRD